MKLKVCFAKLPEDPSITYNEYSLIGDLGFYLIIPPYQRTQ